ncbi:MAG: hypothetical protein CUN55_18935, partial [Phototrophicales bacterium]
TNSDVSKADVSKDGPEKSLQEPNLHQQAQGDKNNQGDKINAGASDELLSLDDAPILVGDAASEGNASAGLTSGASKMSDKVVHAMLQEAKVICSH